MGVIFYKNNCHPYHPGVDESPSQAILCKDGNICNYDINHISILLNNSLYQSTFLHTKMSSNQSVNGYKFVFSKEIPLTPQGRGRSMSVATNLKELMTRVGDVVATAIQEFTSKNHRTTKRCYTQLQLMGDYTTFNENSEKNVFARVFFTAILEFLAIRNVQNSSKGL